MDKRILRAIFCCALCQMIVGALFYVTGLFIIIVEVRPGHVAIGVLGLCVSIVGCRTILCADDVFEFLNDQTNKTGSPPVSS